MSSLQSPTTSPTTTARASRYPRLWNSKSLANQLMNRKHANSTDMPYHSESLEKVIYMRIPGKIQKISITEPSPSCMPRLPGSGETLYQFLYGFRPSKSDRIAHIVADPDVLQFSETTCVCRACGRTTSSVTLKAELLWNWTIHRTKCMRLQALLAAEAKDAGHQDTLPSRSTKIKDFTGNATTSKPRKAIKRSAPSNGSPVPRKKTCHRPQAPVSDEEYVAAAADDDKDDDVYIDITEYQRERNPGPSIKPCAKKSKRAKTKVSIPRQTDTASAPYTYFNLSCTPEAAYRMNEFFKP